MRKGAEVNEQTACVGGRHSLCGLFLRVRCPDVFEEKNPPPGAFKFWKLALNEVSSLKRCCQRFL